MSNQKFNSNDHFAMCIALEEAKIAYAKNEVPVGAVLMIDGKLIAKAHNMVHATHDASMHAEIICLKKAANILQDFRLNEAILYSTLEPCAMCAGAILNFRVKKVIWGAKDLRVGACGTLYNLFDGRHPIHYVESIGGLLEDDSASLLKEFFKLKRAEKNGKDFRRINSVSKK